MKRYCSFGFFVLGVAALFSSGCGRDTSARIQGAIVQKGVRLKVGESESVMVEVVYKDKDGTLKQDYGRFNREDSTFAFDTAIPVGATVQFLVRCEPSDSSGRKERFKYAFATPRSPLAYAVTESGTQEVLLDLDEKRAKKG